MIHRLLMFCGNPCRGKSREKVRGLRSRDCWVTETATETAATWPRISGPVHTSALATLHHSQKTLITLPTANDGSWTGRHYDKPEQTTTRMSTIQNTLPISRFSSLMVPTFILLRWTYLCSHIVSLSYHETREEAVLQTTRYRNSYHLLPQILPQELVL